MKKIGTKVILSPGSYWNDKELPRGAIGIIIGEGLEDYVDIEGWHVDFGEIGTFYVMADNLSITRKAMNYPSYYYRELI